ncbi:MAG: hypothetical protein U0821_27725 [Chloroflexota bacterium]
MSKLSEPVDSSAWLQRPNELCSWLEYDGFIFLRGLLPRDLVLAAGHEVASADASASTHPSVRAIAEAAPLMDLMLSILDVPAALHDLTPHVTRPSSVPALPHPIEQDPEAHAAAATVWSVWVPLCDTSAGLAVSAGSHKQGLLSQSLSSGSTREIDPALVPDDWYGTDYRAGDVLVLHPHAARRWYPGRETSETPLVALTIRYVPGSVS